MHLPEREVLLGMWFGEEGAKVLGRTVDRPDIMYMHVCHSVHMYLP